MALTREKARTLAAAQPDVGNRVAEAIRLAGISQTALATAIGLPYTYVSDTARGRYKTITVENGRKFAEFFGVPIEVLFPAHDTKSAA